MFDLHRNRRSTRSTVVMLVVVQIMKQSLLWNTDNAVCPTKFVHELHAYKHMDNSSLAVWSSNVCLNIGDWMRYDTTCRSVAQLIRQRVRLMADTGKYETTRTPRPFDPSVARDAVVYHTVPAYTEFRAGCPITYSMHSSAS